VLQIPDAHITRDADALTAAGVLALARHDFRGALALGERARAAQPDMVDVAAVLVDADEPLPPRRALPGLP
jgi:hypothetical protein